MKGSQRLLIGKNLAYGYDGTSASGATSPFDLDDGAIGVYKIGSDGDLTLLASGDDITDAPEIYLAVGRENTDGESEPMISNPIKGEHVIRWAGDSYSAPAKQVSYVGYNTTSGAIETNNSENYTLNVVRLNDFTNCKADRKSFVHSGDASVTQYEVAADMAKQINGTYNTYLGGGNQFIVADIVASGSITELSNDATVTNGSKTVTSTSHGVSAGNWVSLQGIVYQAEAIPDSDTITLDRPYRGSSETIDVSATVDKAGKITTISDVGIKLTSTKLGIRFSVGVSSEGFGSTSVTTSTDADFGKGTETQIAEMEADNLGVDYGTLDYVNRYNTQPQSMVVSGTTYDQYIIKVSTVFDSKAHLGNDGFDNILILAVPVGFTGQATFETRLNTWMNSTPRALSPVNL